MNSAEVYEYKPVNHLMKIKTFFKYLFESIKINTYFKKYFFYKISKFFKFNKIYATTCGSTVKNFLLPKMKKAKEINLLIFMLQILKIIWQ